MLPSGHHPRGPSSASSPQGGGRPGAAFVTFLGVQHYVEDGRLIRYH